MKTFKDSASLILAARQMQKCARPSTATNYNYNLLCLKRHKNSKFMPGNYVFPGGIVHPADADLKWNNLFSSFGFDKSSYASLFPNTTTRPIIFKSIPKQLPKEISLRISAIRETFEECGILLCKKSQNGELQPDWAQHIEMPENELHSWQEKVHNDATEFYSLCKNFECYPDLWSLYEWSNWLTPTFFLDKRFNTVFYLACMQTVPPCLQESTEIEDMKWDVPANFIFSGPEFTLPPPQQYEIARIAKFESIDNLLDFANERTKLGVRMNLPVKVELQDGNVYVLPGDSMYPEHANLFDKQVIDRTDITIEQFREMSPVKNRVEFFNLEVKRLFVQNFDDEDGHLSPMSLNEIRIKQTHKK
ncbi:PREDICTED: nucleoside diphosphate-linked moiety X motif 19-like [Dufourea novaeangliae]|uniref:nucleoside diphosphate-linked moiety X motif 19-like n=1 Tax=Dufourea novaeangliae TaxID=178035 RepID=UPI000766E546|nr:PREDICTED: nucleoside diphosphate-linked moiety X motif 19-like [Dufourea novaeangliae]